MTEKGMGGEKPVYLSFLVRLWRTGDEEKGAWRASLEDARTRDCRGFASLDQLFDYLRASIGEQPDPGKDRESHNKLTVQDGKD
jgi:hypothetical protein